MTMFDFESLGFIDCQITKYKPPRIEILYANNWTGQLKKYPQIKSLKPGMKWNEAPLTKGGTQLQVEVAKNSFVPPEQCLAHQLEISGKAAKAYAVEPWSNHIVVMNADYVCEANNIFNETSEASLKCQECIDLFQKFLQYGFDQGRKDWKGGGFPDVVALHENRSITFYEVKANDDKINLKQIMAFCYLMEIASASFLEVNFKILHWGEEFPRQIFD